MKKAYKNSATGRLEKLLDQRSRWMRRQTIATNKLEEVNREIIAVSKQMAKEKDGVVE